VTEVPSIETVADELSARDSSGDQLLPVIPTTEQSSVTSTNTTSESGADSDNSSDDTPASS
jgi:hypothetical protein